MTSNTDLLAQPGWPTAADIDAAREIVHTHVNPTPIVTLNLPGRKADVVGKLETFQPTGAFKVRGALAAVAAYGDRGRIVTASAGNHGLGIAFAASRLAASATIVVPENASPAKVAALGAYDVDLVLHGRSYDDAEQHALALAARDGTYVSAYNDRHVIAGQATIVDEIADRVDGALTIVVPVGGGGLAAGTALAAARHSRDLRVVGVETVASQAVSTAVTTGRVTAVDIGETIADGLAGNIDPDCMTPAILAATNTPIVAADEPAIRAAIASLATDSGIVVEGAGAVGWAALRTGVLGDDDRTVVVVLTGRNITAAAFGAVLA